MEHKMLHNAPSLDLSSIIFSFGKNQEKRVVGVKLLNRFDIPKFFLN